MKTEKVSKSFGRFLALKDVSLDIGTQGKTVVLLLGPNGSGKSTLINCISGVYNPDGGKIWFNGIDITGKEPYEIVELGLGRTFQIARPLRKLTLGESLLLCFQKHPGEKFFASMFKRAWSGCEEEAVQKLFRVLEILGLEDKCDTLAGELSGGQLKLLEIGRSLMMGTKMMLLDEPVGGVNPVIAHTILSHIQKIRDELKVSFLMVEHRLDIVMQYVDYAYAMAQGRIICEGLPKDIVRRRELYDIYL